MVMCPYVEHFPSQDFLIRNAPYLKSENFDYYEIRTGQRSSLYGIIEVYCSMERSDDAMTIV